jgi:hypothetical protein
MKTSQEFLLEQVKAVRQRLHWTSHYSGNLGVMRFSTPNKQSNTMIVGASYSIFYDVLDVVRQGFKNTWVVTTAETRHKIGNKASKNYQIYAHQVREVEGENAVAFNAYWAPLQANRNNDSEFLLVNFLQKYTNLTDGTALQDIEILTELPPCSSCLHVINEFLKKNNKAILRLYHLRPATNTTMASAHPRLSIVQIPSFEPLTRLLPVALAVTGLYSTPEEEKNL